MAVHPNLTAYEKVEDLKNFTEDSFVKYCSQKLAGCDAYVEFIRHNCLDETWHGKICEIGSGSSRLLYRLEQLGLLTSGVGYEASSSRHQFAQKVKDHFHFNHVVNVLGNILEAPPLKEMDLIIGVDLVFQLIAPLYSEAERDLLSWTSQSLKKGGYLILELLDFQFILEQIERSNTGNYLWWESFPSHDPWEFSLARFSLDSQKDIVWDKIFIKRNSSERSSFKNILRNYSPETITRVLEAAGFSARIFSEEESGIKLEPGEFIVAARNEKVS